MVIKINTETTSPPIQVNKSRNSSCDFMRFITEPPVPRKRPDLTTFIHRPLQHFREILKLVQMIASHCRVDSEEHNNFNSIINELQVFFGVVCHFLTKGYKFVSLSSWRIGR